MRFIFPSFRYHLDSFVAMVLVLSGFLYLNLQVRSNLIKGDAEFGVCDVLRQYTRGWPFAIYGATEKLHLAGFLDENGKIESLGLPDNNSRMTPVSEPPVLNQGELAKLEWVWRFGGLAMNMLVGLFVAGLIGVSVELFGRILRGHPPHK